MKTPAPRRTAPQTRALRSNAVPATVSPARRHRQRGVTWSAHRTSRCHAEPTQGEDRSSAPGPMHRRTLKALLAAYRGRWPLETATVARFDAFVDSHPDCFHRSCRVGHITGSAWLVDRSGDRVLLAHHAKLGRWLQPGGHSDGDPDSRPGSGCRRPRARGVDWNEVPGLPVPWEASRPHRGAWIARRPRPCRSVGVPGQRARPTAFRRLPCGQGDLVAMSLRCSTGPALEFLAPFVHRPSPTGAQPRDARVVARRISAKVRLTSVSATPRRVTNSIFVLRR